MKNSSKPLAFCLVLMFAGPLTAPLQAGEGMHVSDRCHRRGPVVSGPAVAPVLASHEKSAGPGGNDELSETLACPEGRERPRYSAPVPLGAPFGASSRALFGAQVANGQAARMVLYQYDFFPDRAALTPAGRRKLERLFPLLVQTPFPLIIEPAGNLPNLDRARRQKVVEYVAGLPYPIPAERVIVALPPSRGISGAEGLGQHVKFMELMIGGGVASGAPEAAPPYALP